MSFDPKYYGVPPAEQIQKENRYAYTATGGQTTFAASYTPGFGPDVYYNGAHLDPRTAFTAADGATVVLTDPADIGASVVIVAKAQVPNYSFYTQAETNALVETFYASSTSGTTSAITATTNPSFGSWLSDGMQVKVRMSSANPGGTTAPTISFNGLTPLTIVRDGQQPLTGGDWVANQEVTLRYTAGFPTTITLVQGSVTAIAPAQFDATNKISTTSFVQNSLGNRSGYSNISATSTTLTAANIGQFIRFGVTAAATCVLPDPASVPQGSSILLFNSSTSTAAVTCTAANGGSIGYLGSGSSYVLQPGTQIEFISSGTTAPGAWNGFNGGGIATLGTSGYQKLPSGLLMQWSIITTSAANTGVVWTYPVAFPHAVLSVQTALMNTAGQTYYSTVYLTPSVTSATIASTYAASAQTYVLAIGY